MWAEDIKVERNQGIPAGTVHMSGVFVSKELNFAFVVFVISFLKLNEEFRWNDMLNTREEGGSGAFLLLQ